LSDGAYACGVKGSEFEGADYVQRVENCKIEVKVKVKLV